MDPRRIVLFAGLAIVSYLIILQWSEDYAKTPDTNIDVMALDVENTDQGIEVSESVSDGSSAVAATNPGAVTDTVEIRTDVLNAVIDLNGGDVVFASLPDYPFSIDQQEIPFNILETGARVYLAQSGLSGKNGTDLKGSRASFSAEKAKYEANGEEPLNVVLTHTADNGLIVEKTFTFTPGSYLIDVTYNLTNAGSETLRMRLYGQLRRDNSSDPSAGGAIGMRSYVGPTFSTESSNYEKVKFGNLDDEKFVETSQGGWAAMLQHYFVTAWVPTQNDTHTFYGRKVSNGQYDAGFQTSEFTVGPGEENTIGAQLYIGPKDQDALSAVAPYLEKTVDYGWLWWIAQPLFKLMQFIQGLIGNWGWSIIFMTIIVKMVLYPLTASSYRSMAKMRKFAPKIQELRESFGDDRQKMSQEMMKLYQKEKLNPLGGCLPMLIQMPIFIALYWVLMESVELRQSPFMFWIEDLSIKDPFFVLPLLMGASMFFQMQMQQQPTMDPMQAKILKWMPVAFTFMFLWFPAGLTLYWFVNNVITIIQQYIVNKSVEKAEKKAA